MKNSQREKLINLSRNYKGFREADAIIKWLADPDNPDNKIPEKLKKDFERYLDVHSLRMRYKQQSYIISFLREKYARTERQARHDIAEAEYVFGKAIRVDRAFEIAFLLECSRKNVELAMNSRNVKNITMALKQHFEILGPDHDQSLLPDFSNFEPHKYNIVLPKGLPEQFMDMVKSGAINLSEIVPSKMIKFIDNDNIEDAQVE